MIYWGNFDILEIAQSLIENEFVKKINKPTRKQKVDSTKVQVIYRKMLIVAKGEKK